MASASSPPGDVLIVVDQFEFGGTEPHILGQCEKLADQGVGTLILSCKRPGPVWTDPNMALLHLPFWLQMTTTDAWTSLRLIPELTRGRNFVAVHAHGPLALIPAGIISSRLNRPLLHTLHGSWHATTVFNRVHGFFTRRQVFSHANRLYSVSEEVSDKVQRHCPQAHPVIQRNGIDGWDMTIPPRPGTGRWAFVSRLTEGNSQSLLRLFEMLDQLPIAGLDVLGDGNDRPMLEAAAQKLKTPVHFLGAMPEAHSHMPGYDGIAGYGGRTALEACAMRRPFLLCHETGVMGILTTAMAEETRARNYTGRDREPLLLDQVLEDWDQRTAPAAVADLAWACAEHHDAAQIWQGYWAEVAAMPEQTPLPHLWPRVRALLETLPGDGRPFASDTQLEILEPPG